MATQVISRFTKFTNLFTRSGRTQNRLMRGKMLPLNKESGYMKGDFYRRDMGDGRVMLRGYFHKGPFSQGDVTYVVNRDGSYRNVRRIPINPLKKGEEPVSGMTRIVEDYTQTGILENAVAHTRLNIPGQPAINQRVRFGYERPIGGHDTFAVADIQTGDKAIFGHCQSNGSLNYEISDKADNYLSGGNFNIFEKLGGLFKFAQG